MAEEFKGPFVFDGIINDTKKLQELKKWYKQVYFRKYSWESKFNWETATSLNMMYRRKHNTMYQTGDGGLFNGITKKLTYSVMTFQEELITLDTMFTAARQISPIENDFIDGLTKTDIAQLIEAEVNYKRKSILDTLQKPNVVNTLVSALPKDEASILKFFDDLQDRYMLINANITDILCNATIFRLARNYLKLKVYSEKQVNEFVETRIDGNSVVTVEGLRLWLVPDKFEYNAGDGTTQELTLLSPTTLAIALESGSQQDALALRQKVHTPLRTGPAGLGLGVGMQWYLEWIKTYGTRVKEPKKIIRVVTAIDKKSITDSNSTFKVILQDPITLDAFTNTLITAISTQEGFLNISTNDIDLLQSDGTTPLTVDDLSFTTVGVVIKAKTGSTFYKDQKTIYVTIQKGL